MRSERYFRASRRTLPSAVAVSSLVSVEIPVTRYAEATMSPSLTMSGWFGELRIAVRAPLSSAMPINLNGGSTGAGGAVGAGAGTSTAGADLTAARDGAN